MDHRGRSAARLHPWSTGDRTPDQNHARFSRGDRADGAACRHWRTLLSEQEWQRVGGGTFSTAGGITPNRIARCDGTSWSALGGGVAPVSSARRGRTEPREARSQIPGKEKNNAHGEEKQDEYELAF